MIICMNMIKLARRIRNMGRKYPKNKQNSITGVPKLAPTIKIMIEITGTPYDIHMAGTMKLYANEV